MSRRAGKEDGMEDLVCLIIPLIWLVVKIR